VCECVCECMCVYVCVCVCVCVRVYVFVQSIVLVPPNGMKRHNISSRAAGNRQKIATCLQA